MPQQPASPDKPLDLFLALIGGSISAIGLAFFFEYCDNRIKSPTEIKAHLGLPFIGMVPKMSVAEGESAPLLDKGATPNFAEAMRTVRTNVLFSSTSDGGQSIVVTSSGPGEGKTVVSSNLALALAQTGQRVLLIDADMRRPRVHQVFAERQEPGLSNILVGDTKTGDAVRPTSCSTLWILPAGHLPPNPAELLGSKRFEDFIETLKDHFAFVIIDSPPIMAVSDSAIVAHMADGVLFVIGSDDQRQFAKGTVDFADYERLGQQTVFAWRVRLGALLPAQLAALASDWNPPSGSAWGSIARSPCST